MTLVRPRRRLLWVLAGISALVLLGSLYLLVSLNGVRSLERHWRHAEALSKAYNDYASDSRWDDYQTADFVIEGAKDDRDPIIRYATQEYARELRAEAGRVEGVLAVDPGIRRLRRDTAAALRAYADGLVEAAKLAKVTPPIFDQRTDVTVRTLSQLRRWGLRPLTKEVTARFEPDVTKAAVAPLLDDRTGVRLVTVSDRDLVTVDVDTGRVTAIWKDWENPQGFLFEARRGWVAYRLTSIGHAWEPGTAVGPELGAADRLLDGPNPDTVWVTRQRATSDAPTPLAEVDRTGREVSTAKAMGIPVGITTNHVVSWTIVPESRRLRARILVTDRASGQQVRTIDDAIPFGTQGNLLAWGGGLVDPIRGKPTTLHVLDVATGQQRAVPAPDAASPPVAAVFSPDGGALAVLWQDGGRTTSRVAVHPLDTLKAPAFVPADAQMPAASLVWAPKSDRVFFLLHPPDKAVDGVRIGTMRRADNVVQRLRIRGAFRSLDAF